MFCGLQCPVVPRLGAVGTRLASTAVDNLKRNDSTTRNMAKYQNGMNKVYSPPEREDATSPIANIVFVHGLLGHPWKTWANESVKDSKKPFWPEDFLPKVAPNARIFSFGYDADVERFMSAVSLNTVHQHGRNLLNDLCDLIDEDATNIPFIFIVHSLGGLVLKEVRLSFSPLTRPWMC